MNEQEKQTLNEKLARWAGFAEADIRKRFYFAIGGERLAKWYRPGSEYSDKLPNFANSLDACFKWLVPKLRAITINNPLDKPNEWQVDIFAGGGIGKLLDRTYGEAETPALALCLAVEWEIYLALESYDPPDTLTS